MNRRALVYSLILVVLVTIGLAACTPPGEGEEDAAAPGSEQQANSGGATSTPATSPTPAPTTDLSSLLEEEESPQVPVVDIAGGVSGIGAVEARRDANLVFTVNGTVQDVYVEEGTVVTQGQVLAILDVRVFEHEMDRAEAGVTIAQAQKSALSEAPRAADVQAANAQIRQAEAGLARLQQLPEEIDLRAAQASLKAAEINLQSTRDKLSHQKIQAELQVRQAAYQLTQAQWQYALAQRYWEHADEEGTNPVQPSSKDMTGADITNDLSEGQEAQYRVQYEQAKAAMELAEESFNQALVVAEGARKSEVTGVQAAEQQVVQAQIQLEKVAQGANENEIAQAQAGVDLAVANRARLYPDPTESQIIIADAQIRQAESALELAHLNREYAELRAPFEGIVSEVNIDPGDPGMSARDAAIKVVDMENMYIDVDISDVDISSVNIGQEASAYADALPGKLFTGDVSYIAPMATVSGNVRTYEVRIQLDDTQGLRPGMSVRVEIDTSDSTG